MTYSFPVDTDHGFLDYVLEKCIPKFWEVIGTVRMVSNYHSLSKDEEQEINESLKEITVKKDDPFHGLAKYVIDAPEIGFKIYLDKAGFYTSQMILVNTKKTK